MMLLREREGGSRGTIISTVVGRVLVPNVTTPLPCCKTCLPSLHPSFPPTPTQHAIIPHSLPPLSPPSPPP